MREKGRVGEGEDEICFYPLLSLLRLWIFFQTLDSLISGHVNMRLCETVSVVLLRRSCTVVIMRCLMGW